MLDTESRWIKRRRLKGKSLESPLASRSRPRALSRFSLVGSHETGREIVPFHAWKMVMSPLGSRPWEYSCEEGAVRARRKSRRVKWDNSLTVCRIACLTTVNGGSTAFCGCYNDPARSYAIRCMYRNRCMYMNECTNFRLMTKMGRCNFARVSNTAAKFIYLFLFILRWNDNPERLLLSKNTCEWRECASYVWRCNARIHARGHRLWFPSRKRCGF